MNVERHHTALIVASVVTVASFVGATAYTQARLARLDAVASTLETNAIPSIEYLSRTVVRLTHLNQLLDEAAAAGPRRASAVMTARLEMRAIEDDVGHYVELPPLAGEEKHWEDLRADVRLAAQAVRRTLDDEEQRGDALTSVRPQASTDDALDVAMSSALTTLNFDVRRAETLARDVRDVRVATLRTIVALDAGATALAVVGVFVAFRASRRHDRLLQQHASLLKARVDELDLFAGRVAHDVLSPLGTIATALSLLAHSDERSQRYVDRSQRALQHVRQLVEGLLTFARSGARPDSGAACSLDAAIRTIVGDCSEAAVTKGVELVTDVSEPIDVRCSLGVITSILQNLVRNAIKYMGDSPTKRIVIRVTRRGTVARVDVEDTGPGIPPDLQNKIFHPFVRGAHADVKGTGLGLATVKRLAESHGGSVGVRSTVGAGSVFRVELPLAVSAGVADAPSPSETTQHV
jgi:signal transduction histidine kinase